MESEGTVNVADRVYSISSWRVSGLWGAGHEESHFKATSQITDHSSLQWFIRWCSYEQWIIIIICKKPTSEVPRGEANMTSRTLKMILLVTQLMFSMLTAGGAHRRPVRWTGWTETNNVASCKEDPADTENVVSPENRRDGNGLFCVYYIICLDHIS